MPSKTSVPAARAFVQSLNLLLKFSRLYGMGHARSAAQLETAWMELEAALAAAGEAGLLLGAAGSQLLLDGVPLETTAAERSFADMLAAAGVASLSFGRGLTRQAFADFIRVFAPQSCRPIGLVARLEAALDMREISSIRINKPRLIAEATAVAGPPNAAELAARDLRVEKGKLPERLKSPEKLLEFISAALGADLDPAGTGASAEDGTSAGDGSRAQSVVGMGTEAGPGEAPPREEETLGVFRLLVQLGEAHCDESVPANPAAWRKELERLPKPVQRTMRRALASLATAASSVRPSGAALVSLAEDLAIRFALEYYGRGEGSINTLRQMLESVSKEVESLRKLFRAREDKLASAGFAVESYGEFLACQFWAAVPASDRRSILLSPEAWCLPPHSVRQSVEELYRRGETFTAQAILIRYADCVRTPDLEARRRVSMSLARFAELYGRLGGRALDRAIGDLGAQMAEESDPELQTLLSGAFVRLSQEAASRRNFVAIDQAHVSLSAAEKNRPGSIQILRPQIGVQDRLPEFIEEAVKAPRVPEGLLEVLRRVPQATAEQLSLRLPHSIRCSERERLVELAQQLGEPVLLHVREVFSEHRNAKAIQVLGLLSRLDPATVADFLPARLREGTRPFHDSVVRQLSAAGGVDRGTLLLDVLELFDPMISPWALNEIGMSGDPAVAPDLLRLAEGELPPSASLYLRAKAIEALGRLREPVAAPSLRNFLEARRAFRWVHPKELRVAAAQALEKLDPEWLQAFLPQSGFSAGELALAPRDASGDGDFARLRCYSRISAPRRVNAVLNTSGRKSSGIIRMLSLEGGLVAGEMQTTVGSEAMLKISAGLRPINVPVLVRNVRSRQVGFEMMGMDLKDRSRLRRLLVSFSSAAAPVAHGFSRAATPTQPPGPTQGTLLTS